jgi:hypothetical protein
VPLGFCCGGFSSTAGYDTGNEAQACGLSDYATSRSIISSKHDAFLSASLTASLSASAWGVISNCKPLAAALKRRVTAPLADPLAGHDAREHRNRVRVIHPAWWVCQEENTLTIRA